MAARSATGWGRARTTYDAVVVVPGIMGSELCDAQTGEELWSSATIAAFVRGASLDKLSTLRVDERERSGDAGRIKPTALLRKPWWLPFAGGAEPYVELTRKITAVLSHPAALLEFAYDWR